MKQTELLAVLLVIQIVLVLSSVLDIAVARAAFGLLYITIMPGIVIINFLKPNLEKIERIIFSVGVSLAFFMGIGFVVNFLGPALGVLAPLGSTPLLITTFFIIDPLALLACKASSNRTDDCVSIVNYGSRKLDFFVPFLFLLPLLSIIGALNVAVAPHSSNSVLLLVLFAIAALAVSLAFCKQLSSEMYLSILFAIALALLFQFAFFSNYLVGGDIFSEYSAFDSVLKLSYWDIQGLGRLNAMLSVTILPTIYSNIMGINGIWVFKAIYPLLFSLVPLGLYQLFRSQIGERSAFFSVFFFMSNFVFFMELPELPRQMIAELFYILLFLTIVKKDLQNPAKLIFFCFFSFGVIASHYAMAYIFFAFIVAFWLIGRFRKQASILNFSMITLFGTLLFGWYIYTSSGSTFSDLLGTISYLSQNFLSDFLNPQSRGATTLAGLGNPVVTTFLHIVGQYLFNLTELLIFIGIVAALVKYKRRFFENGHNVFALLNLVLLGLCVIIPGLALTFNMERFYQVSLFFLAPFCILGGIYILSLVFRNKINAKVLGLIMVLAVLVPVFLFQTGFIYEITKEESASLPLSSYRFDSIAIAWSGIIKSPAVLGAEWLRQNNKNMTVIYTDALSVFSLQLMNVQHRALLYPNQSIPSHSFVYLTEYNLYHEVLYLRGSYLNLTQVIQFPTTVSTIYSSGLCEICQNNE